MYFKPPACPNKDCGARDGKWYSKKGYFKTKHNHQPVPKYRCNSCGKYFSSHTFRASKYQKRPELNQQIFNLYASGTTQRRLSEILGCNRKTVATKIRFLANIARRYHEKMLESGKLKTTFAQIDEIETFEHTKYRPLSVALAVRVKTGEIIDAQVATFASRLGTRLPLKYKDEYREDTRKAAIEDCVISVKKASGDTLRIESDETKWYFSAIKEFLPEANYARVEKKIPEIIPREIRLKMKKPLFTINYVCAKLRNDLSRMSRKTWVTTKRAWALQAHLDIYIAWNNKYPILKSA